MFPGQVILRNFHVHNVYVFYGKKPDNTYRVCVNFRELNKITIFDPEPMMLPDDIFPSLAGSKIYSSFDFCKGYYRPSHTICRYTERLLMCACRPAVSIR